MVLRLILTLCGMLVWAVRAQDSLQSIRTYYAQFHYGSIFAHSPEVENTKGARPFGIEMGMEWRSYSPKMYQQFRQYPAYGLALSYYDFDFGGLGRSLISYGYFCPMLSAHRRLEIRPKFGMGLAILSNPYHPTRNPSNASYSLPVSVYLQLGLEMYTYLSSKIAIGAGIHYQHVSNGGLKLPNKGINWPTFSMGIKLRPRCIQPPKVPDRASFQRVGYPIMYLLMGGRNVTSGALDWRWIYGLGGTWEYRFAQGHSMGIGVEVFEDRTLRHALDIAGRTSSGSLRTGVLIMHEFILGKLCFGQYLGWYPYRHQDLYPAWYQRYVLSYALTTHLRIGASLLAHLNVANYPDIRLIYRIK